MKSPIDDFDSWNVLKKKIETEINPADKYPKEGEVWMSSVGKNIGFEQNGSGDNFSRPVVIIKKFNNHMFWSVPLSTKQKDFDFYYNYTDINNQAVSAILAQMKLMSIKRLKRKLYEVDEKKLGEIKVKLKLFL
jgi:mRNA interferase MazF